MKMSPGDPPPLTSHTVKLTADQGKKLVAHLKSGAYELKDVPYAVAAGSRKDLNLVYYESGKLVVQGKGTREFVEFTLEPEILQEVKLGYETILNPALLDPRIGVDESGKGDFFGPLCVAGVYVNATIIELWKTLGIRDSKAIGSDRRIAELAESIQKTPGCVWTIVPIGNEAYNRMHDRNRSVNKVLAWGHARVIENLLSLRYRMIPPPVRAISDQFAADKATIEKALMSMGRDFKLEQRHKAEEDIAVAAASILARNEFVTRLRRLGVELGVELPKGASAAVEAAGKQIVSQHGKATLGKISKMHFRTRYRVLGEPEPPKVEWKRPTRKP